ncbi:hypothetical protein DRP05_00395 [Archaeoglobales archaeon]|nr:MAG: hypothetical protein DRP05_00395 [Archaeoglobales archaeon]
MNVRDAEFCVIDLETTGLDLRKDKIIAFACVPMKGMKILVNNSYYTLIKPEKYEIKAMKYHGISQHDLNDAPTFEEISEEILTRLKGIVVGHAVEIDVAFLKKYFKKAGIKFERQTIDIALLEKWLGERLGERKTNEDLTLDALIKNYGLKATYRHNALADAFFTAQIFQIQLLKLLKYGINSVDRILGILSSCKLSRCDFIF